MRTGKMQEWQEADKLTLLTGWRRDGLKYDQIASNIGITVKSLYNWVNKSEEIRNALKKGEEVMIYETENAMYKAAIGYDVTETEQSETVYPDGTKVVNKRARKRHIPPSIGAICFILKNRRSDMWQDKPIKIDTTALDKLDEILKEARENAEVQPEAE